LNSYLPSSPQPADYLQCECAILSVKFEAITFPSLVTVQSCQLSVFSQLLEEVVQDEMLQKIIALD
jgi:hypothetical protein